MKRILGLLLGGSLVSVIFTGCSSMLVDYEPDSSLANSIAAMETSGNGIRINYDEGDAKKEPPNYLEQNLEKKFQNLEGKAAFKIKDGHSQKTDDLEKFQIGDLMADGTFYYCYVTRMEGNGGNRRKVHCAAAYNYRTEAFRVIHETNFASGSIPEDQESFYIQVCERNGGETDIFVYDNGIGTVYSQEGRIRLQADIESLVRARYSNAHTVTVSYAMTDGDNRIYLELVVEKERVDISEDPDAGQNHGEEDSGEDDQMEKEINDKVANMVMVYDFTLLDQYAAPNGASIVQSNENHEKQKEAWIKMTEGKEYDSDPDGAEDWKSVSEEIPVKWGAGRLEGYGALEMMAWKNGIRFDNKQEASFQPESGSYEGFANVTTNTNLANVFVMDGKRWCGVGGRTGGEQVPFDEETITRTYTLVTTSTSTDSEGNTVSTEEREEKSQSITVTRKIRTALSPGWVEGYRFVENAESLGGCMNHQILASTDEKLYWIRPDRSMVSAGSIQEEGMVPGMFMDGNRCYLLQYNGKKMLVAHGSSWDRAAYRWEIPYSRLTSRYAQGTTKYDQAFDQLNQLQIQGGDVYSNSDYYTGENVLKADFQTDRTHNGFLLTSRNKGIVYYEPALEEALLVAEGSWYRTWKQGRKYLSVGFSHADSSYDSMDVAFARIYEYDLEQLFGEAQKEARRQEESKQAAQAADREKNEESSGAGQDPAASGEGILEDLELPSMEDTWREDYKSKWTSVDFENAMREGETFDSKAYEASEAERRQNEEAEQKARIDAILGGMSDTDSENELSE